MDEVQQIVRRAHAISKRSGVSISTLSRKLLGNGVRLSELEAGGSLRVDTLVTVKQKLDALEARA